MGGCEIARYLGKYGSKRVSKAVIIGGVPPFLLKTDDLVLGGLSATFTLALFPYCPLLTRNPEDWRFAMHGTTGRR